MEDDIMYAVIVALLSTSISKEEKEEEELYKLRPAKAYTVMVSS